MKLGMFAKNSILLLVVFVIVVSGIFFDVHESMDFSSYFGYDGITEQSEASNPLTANSYENCRLAHVLSVAEIKDVSVLSEVIKKLERSSSNRRIVVLTLILCLFLPISTFYKSNLPSIFPWTNVICSRNTVMTFIHDQDGLK